MQSAVEMCPWAPARASEERRACDEALAPRASTLASAELSSPVWLRLIRGAAEQSLFMVDGDETLTVGASEECGWSVRGADVPPEALELRTLAGHLFARAAAQGDVRIDGEQLTAMWVPVDRGARLQIGSVQIEVGLSGRSRAAQSQSLTSTLGAEASLDEAADSLLARFSITDISSSALTQSLCDDTCAATVLDPDAIERPRVPWRSAGVLFAGSLLACAYGCWVLLLDHL